jgi:hypothetical protein
MNHFGDKIVGADGGLPRPPADGANSFLRPIVVRSMAESAEFRKSARTPATAAGRLYFGNHVLALV